MKQLILLMGPYGKIRIMDRKKTFIANDLMCPSYNIPNICYLLGGFSDIQSIQVHSLAILCPHSSFVVFLHLTCYTCFRFLANFKCNSHIAWSWPALKVMVTFSYRESDIYSLN